MVRSETNAFLNCPTDNDRLDSIRSSAPWRSMNRAAAGMYCLIYSIHNSLPGCCLKAEEVSVYPLEYFISLNGSFSSDKIALIIFVEAGV
jgi:hypothetical protein